MTARPGRDKSQGNLDCAPSPAACEGQSLTARPLLPCKYTNQANPTIDTVEPPHYVKSTERSWARNHLPPLPFAQAWPKYGTNTVRRGSRDPQSLGGCAPSTNDRKNSEFAAVSSAFFFFGKTYFIAPCHYHRLVNMSSCILDKSKKLLRNNRGIKSIRGQGLMTLSPHSVSVSTLGTVASHSLKACTIEYS